MWTDFIYMMYMYKQESGSGSSQPGSSTATMDIDSMTSQVCKPDANYVFYYSNLIFDFRVLVSCMKGRHI